MTTLHTNHPKPVFDLRLYLRAIAYFRQDLGQILWSLGMIGTMIVVGLLNPFPLAILIGFFVNGRHNDWIHRVFMAILPSDQHRIAQIIVLGLYTLLLGFFQQTLQMYQKLLDIRIGYNGLMRVRCDLFRKLQALSLGYHRSQPQGDAIYRLSWDTFGAQTILNFVTGTLLNLLSLVGTAALMFLMNWKLTLLSLTIVPLLWWVIRRYARVLEEQATASKEVEAELTTVIQRSVASVGLVQAFGREAEEYKRFHGAVRNTVATNMKMHWQELMFWFMLGMVFTLGTTVITAYGGYQVYRGLMPVEYLTIFLTFLATRLYDPLRSLSSGGATLQAGAAGMRRVFEVLDRDPVIADAPDAISLPRQPRVFKLENASFEYNPGEPVLRDISVTINPGDMVAFVGSSGVGKTTLLNLLPRFYDPTAGVLTLDGHDLRHIKVADLRKHIALVLQDSVILPTSIAENIAYGRPQATPPQILQAAKMAGADVFIDKLNDKYDTQVNEGGQNLSGGQRQRIAIARALLTEAPIVVLDEPTSALDPQHEQMIIETLRDLRRQRTIILVSHRLSTVADCDRIFVMENGRIVESGKHDELVAAGGLYFKMAKHQMRLGLASDQSPVTTSPSATAPPALS